MIEQETINLIVKNPVLIQILAILYVVGLVFKAICAAYLKYVESTSSKRDDKSYADFLNRPTVKVLLLILDFVFRIKIQVKEKQNAGQTKAE